MPGPSHSFALLHFQQCFLLHHFHSIQEIARMAEWREWLPAMHPHCPQDPDWDSGKQCGGDSLAEAPSPLSFLLDTDFGHSCFSGAAESSVFSLLPAEMTPENGTTCLTCAVAL